MSNLMISVLGSEHEGFGGLCDSFPEDFSPVITTFHGSSDLSGVKITKPFEKLILDCYHYFRSISINNLEGDRFDEVLQKDIPEWLLQYIRVHTSEKKVIFLVMPDGAREEEGRIVGYDDILMRFNKFCERRAIKSPKIKPAQPSNIVDLVVGPKATSTSSPWGLTDEQ